jgi:hypothetical protein
VGDRLGQAHTEPLGYLHVDPRHATRHLVGDSEFLLDF